MRTFPFWKIIIALSVFGLTAVTGAGYYAFTWARTQLQANQYCQYQRKIHWLANSEVSLRKSATRTDLLEDLYFEKVTPLIFDDLVSSVKALEPISEKTEEPLRQAHHLLQSDLRSFVFAKPSRREISAAWTPLLLACDQRTQHLWLSYANESLQLLAQDSEPPLPLHKLQKNWTFKLRAARLLSVKASQDLQDDQIIYCRSAEKFQKLNQLAGYFDSHCRKCPQSEKTRLRTMHTSAELAFIKNQKMFIGKWGQNRLPSSICQPKLESNIPNEKVVRSAENFH